MEKFEQYIKKHANLLPPRYIRVTEQNMNPGYENIKQIHLVCPIPENHHRIFVLKPNFDIITGVKLEDKIRGEIPEKFHSFIDWADTYGHPSIAEFKHVYYAGYISQRSYGLEVFLRSGRYYAHASANTLKAIEIYLSFSFMEAYGKQPVRFYDEAESPGAFDKYIDNLPRWFSNRYPHREYEPDFIYNVKDAVDSCYSANIILENCFFINLTWTKLARLKRNFCCELLSSAIHPSAYSSRPTVPAFHAHPENPPPQQNLPPFIAWGEKKDEPRKKRHCTIL